MSRKTTEGGFRYFRVEAGKTVDGKRFLKI